MLDIFTKTKLSFLLFFLAMNNQYKLNTNGSRSSSYTGINPNDVRQTVYRRQDQLVGQGTGRERGRDRKDGEKMRGRRKGG